MIRTIKKFCLLFLILSPLAFGQATTGYHRVSQVLARAPQGVTAQVVPYAVVTVTQSASGSAAVIYSDAALSHQISPPVVTADASGNYSYYIPLNYMVTENISAPGQGSFVYPNIGSNAPSIGTSGPQYSILEYTTAGSGTAVGPSNITTDSTGNNLTIPGTVRVSGVNLLTVAEAALPANGVTTTTGGNLQAPGTVAAAAASLTGPLTGTTGTFSGTVTAPTFIGSLTGGASLDLPLTGGTLTGPLIGASATFSGTVAAGTTNGVVQAPLQTGTDAGAKLATAIASLSSNGGAVETGAWASTAQVISTDPFSGVTKPFNMTWHGNFTLSTPNISFAANQSHAFAPDATFNSATSTNVIALDSARNVAHLVGLQENYTESLATSGNTIGNILSPPISTATPNQGFDFMAFWYNDFGLQWRSSAGGSPALNQYSWCWNYETDPAGCPTTGNTYDPQRHPLLGWFRGDEANVLDWEAYWLAEYGVKGVVLQNSGGTLANSLSTSTWATPTNQYYWIYQLFNNAQNFKRLKYMMWGAWNDTVVNLTTQWEGVISLAAQYPNNAYTVQLNGKSYLGIYLFAGDTLRSTLAGESSNITTFLEAMSAYAQQKGFSGIAVFARQGTNQYAGLISYNTLEANGVLYFLAPYEGQDFLDTTQTTYGTYTGSFPYPESPNTMSNPVYTISTTATSSGVTTFTTTANNDCSAGDLALWTGTTDTALNGQRYGYVVSGGTSGTPQATFTVTTVGTSGTGGTVECIKEPSRFVMGVATAAKSMLPSTSGWNWPGTTPALFETYLRNTLNFVQTNGLPRIVFAYNVGEWEEGGPMLQPNEHDGFGYLQAVKDALNTSSGLGLTSSIPMTQTGTASGCTTGTTVGSNCASNGVVNWPIAWPDTTYRVTCQGTSPLNSPGSVYEVGKGTGNYVFNYQTFVAAGSSWGTVTCIGQRGAAMSGQ